MEIGPIFCISLSDYYSQAFLGSFTQPFVWEDNTPLENCHDIYFPKSMMFVTREKMILAEMPEVDQAQNVKNRKNCFNVTQSPFVAVRAHLRIIHFIELFS